MRPQETRLYCSIEQSNPSDNVLLPPVMVSTHRGMFTTVEWATMFEAGGLILVYCPQKTESIDTAKRIATV